MSRLAAWLDNPLLVKHARSRLRRRQWLLPLVVVQSLGLCILYGGFALGGLRDGTAFGVLLALQSLLVVIMGAAQVATSVGGARETGILDFHRVSPQPPAATMLGFFLGSPIREYLLCAATIPFSLVCVAMGMPHMGGFAEMMIELVLVAWLFHAVAMLNALTLKKPRAATRGVVGLVLLIFVFGGGFVGVFAQAPAVVDAEPTLSFFGMTLPWWVVVAVFEVPALAFLLIASTRKMASERAHPLSKPQAVACLATVTVLVLGGCWDVQEFEYLVLVVEYLLIIVALTLTLTVTPGLGEYTKGVRRAEKMGRDHLRFWDDAATNRGVLAVLCLIVLGGATIAWEGIEGRPGASMSRGASPYSLPIAIGVLVVAYFGLALQFFQLWSSRRALALLGLFLFLAWVVPLILGAIALGAGGSEDVGQLLLGLSPVAGIAMAAGVGDLSSYRLAQAAAVGSALAWAFLFNNLVTIARRRAERAIHRVPQDRPAPSDDRPPRHPGGH